MYRLIIEAEQIYEDIGKAYSRVYVLKVDPRI